MSQQRTTSRSEDTIDATALIDDDGTVDARRLNDIDDDLDPYQHVTAEVCAETRRRLLDGAAVHALGNGDELPHTATPLRRHARGECSHEHAGPPPLAYQGSPETGEWVIADA